MDVAVFVVSTLAGAWLKEVAVDSYRLIKSRLGETFKAGAVIEALEQDPNDLDTRDFLAKKLTKSGAIEDSQILTAAQLIAAELEKLPDDTPLGANLTVRDLKAKAVEFRRNRIHPGGTATFEKIEVTGRLIVEDNEVGDDRKG